MSSALGIVPPDDDWDSIQRARHLTGDPSYTLWPPCIRLFHPFTRQLALKVAETIEKYNVEAFELTLDSLSVVPNLEAMEADWKSLRKVPTQESRKDARLSTEESETLEMIQEEERIAKEHLKLRLLREARQRKINGKEPRPLTEMQARSLAHNTSPSAFDKQKLMYEEYNGPCLVCLEPDQEGKDRLSELRSILCDELGLYPDFSASSSISGASKLPLVAKETDFRALIPIGSFQTVNAAIESAKNLRKSWTPLTFNVTNFQVVSSDDHLEKRMEDALYGDHVEYQLRKNLALPSIEDKQISFDTRRQFGCDALIMFVGEESASEPSAPAPPEFEVIDEQTDDLDDLAEEMPPTTAEDGLKLWLDDDVVDEGTVMLKGRTLFFTGETREYVAMPATSVMDSKDSPLGGSVSGAARRRCAVHRTGDTWKDGDWGTKEPDLMPWSKLERGAMAKAKQDLFDPDKDEGAVE